MREINQRCFQLISALGDIKLDTVKVHGANFNLELVWHMGRYLVLIGDNDIMVYGIYPELEAEGLSFVKKYSESLVLTLMNDLTDLVLKKLAELKKERQQAVEEVRSAIETIGTRFPV